MAAGIEEDDMMFSASGIRPWHGLGKVIDEAVPSGEAIKVAAMDWLVEQHPILTDNGIPIEGHKANVRSDTGKVLGLVSDKYRVMQNKECFGFMDSILSNSEGAAKYETAGSLFNGKKIFLLARMPDCTLVGDKVESYMFLMSSHDGSCGLTCGLTNVRVVCNNTLQLAVDHANRIWSVRHTTNMANKAIIAKACLLQAAQYQSQLPALADDMVRKKVNEEAFFRKLFSSLKMGDQAKEDATAQIAFLHRDKPDLQNFKGTAWGLYNAVADFASHIEPARPNPTTQDRKMQQFMEGMDILTQAERILRAA